ncbi:sensor histidine kinase [Nodularia spumigena]|uniref:sensor histidine kinase n=1 Tax=Nodularia spumigena TaxID=70799 RepID=UPI002B213D5C|nr:ATP-binding protein [Nodularia spumigena]MEA5557656.1 ATP-binding protein [Nodularia spumigena CH309]
MTESSRTALLVFIASVLTVIGLLGFTTARMITLEREELRARTDASHQESLRLALWRLDSAIAPIIAQEAARPYFHYLSYYPEQRAFTRIWEPVLPGEVLVPSPLVEGTPRFVLLHFQLNALGVLTSPQVPRGNDRDLAESEPNGTARIQRFERILETFQTYFPPDLARFSEPRRTVPTGPFATEAPSMPPSEVALGDEADPRTQATFRPGGGTSQTQAGQSRTRAPFPTETDAQSQAEIEYTFRKEAAELAASPAPVVSPIPAIIGKAESTAAEPDLSKPGPPLAQHARTKSLPDDPADSHQRGSHGNDTAAPATTRTVQQPVERAEGAIRINAGNRLSPTSGVDPPEAIGGTQALDGPFTPAMPANAPSAASSRPDMNQTPFLPRWRVARPGDTPMLTFWRTVRTESSITAQGFWVDWPALERHLLSLVSDLLPEAAILPILTPTEGEPEITANLLASIPAKLIAPPPATSQLPIITPAHLTLALTWLATLGAIAAVGVSLRASIALGERRGRFVSAVTHELRTPLTTFCLYSQMLADGMVTDEQARREYIETLRDESTRLQRIVENVLEFARLGRAHAPAQAREPLGLRQTLEHLLPALSHRAEQGGARVALSIDPSATDLHVRVSRDVIERILLNLVDNACKYGVTPDESIITIMLRKHGASARILVQDRGPGISTRDRRSIFKPFARGRAHHTSPAQGLGLGLSLARALAEQAGGTLELLADTQPGATFQATFPLAEPPGTPETNKSQK